MAKWQMDNFPFIPEKFQYKVKSSLTNREKADSGAKNNLIQFVLYSLEMTLIQLFQHVIMIVRDKSWVIVLFIISKHQNKYIVYY